MSKMLAKMNLISAVQQLPKEDVETVQGYVEMIEKENQELNLELSGYRQAILNNKEMLGLKEENEKLKKQLKPNYYVKGLEGTLKEYQQEMNNVANQQKEFIKYLEDEIQRKRKKSTTLTSFKRNVVPLQHCLQKYKEIIEKGDVR